MEARRIYWTTCAGVFIVDALAAAITPWLDYTFNLTNSLPGALYMIRRDEEVKKGELIVYRWCGGATYPVGTTFVKHVAGVADDTVKRAGSVFWVNGQYISTAEPFSRTGMFLQPAQGGVVGAGEYLASTSNPNSLGSWYVLTGNIKQTGAIRRTYEIF